MSNYEYQRLLSQTVDNALLHLWLNVAGSGRYQSRADRNKLLIRWLKPKVKCPKHRPIKQELKSMILAGRRADGHLEEKLCQLQELSLKYQAKLTDMHRFQYVLKHLREKHEIDADFCDQLSEYKPKTIYVFEKDVEECFSNNNQQVKPLSVYILSSEAEMISNIISQFGIVEIKDENKNGKGTSCLTFRLSESNSR